MWQRLPVEERALCALVKVTKQALVCLPYLLQCDSSPWRLTRSFINEAGGAAVARRATPRVVICVVRSGWPHRSQALGKKRCALFFCVASSSVTYSFFQHWKLKPSDIIH